MYKVIIDSCGELFPEMIEDERFMNIPLTLEVDGEVIMDDENFDQAYFLKRAKESPTGPRSSCPAPGKYLEAIQGEAEHVYIVTLSGEMSGSYNSAVVAKEMYEEEHSDKEIYVFDSRSASVGQTLIGHKVAECEEQGMSFAVMNGIQKIRLWRPILPSSTPSLFWRRWRRSARTDGCPSSRRGSPIRCISSRSWRQRIPAIS